MRDGVFVLETMLWPDEVRKPDFGFLDEDISVRPQELAMAGSLIETLAGDFDPSQYTDGYREALQAVIDAKVAGREVVSARPSPRTSGGAVLDLMAALRASVDAAKGKKAASSGSTDAAESADGAEDADARRGKARAKRATEAPARRPPPRRRRPRRPHRASVVARN